MIPFEDDKFDSLRVNFMDKIVSRQFNLKYIYLRRVITVLLNDMIIK